MIDPKTPQQSSLLLALCGVAASLVVGGGLAWLARPSDYGDRRAALAAKVERMEMLAAKGGRASLAAGAVCRSAGEADLVAFKQSLAATAEKASVTLTDLAAAPDESMGLLAPVSLQLQATAPYEAISPWLETLAAGSPAVFVDSLDIVSRPPTVNLKLKGKVFCWSSRPR